jgi:imidazolonepropionase-like amidohydrolase
MFFGTKSRRRYRAGVFAALATVVLSGAGQSPETRVLIDRVHILDGHGRPPVPGRILIERARIARSCQIRAGTGQATVIDGEGGYLLPGFIDMHAHLMQPRCRPENGRIERFDRAVSERMMSVLLDFGITTVRSPATPTVDGLKLRDDLNAGRVRGPRAFASTELIDDPKLTDEQLGPWSAMRSLTIQTTSRFMPACRRRPSKA